MSPAGRRTGAIGIAESLETYPVRIMRRPLHSTLTVLSCSGLHAAFEVFGVGACEVAASGLGYRPRAASEIAHAGFSRARWSGK